MANIWSDEKPEQRESRLAMCACLNADVIFRGVRHGMCYFEVDLWAALGLAQTSISAAEAKNHVGEKATVCGEVQLG